MKILLYVSGVLIFTCITQCAIADGRDINAGTDGQDLQFVFEIHDNLGARFNFNFVDYASLATLPRDEMDLTHDPKLNLNAMNALLDWHPVENDFFVSGGAVANRNKSPAISQGSFNPNYSNQANLVKSAPENATPVFLDTVNNVTVSPYLGMGWKTRHARKKGWAFSSDVGVMYHGRSTVSLENASCLILNSGAFGMCQNADGGSAGGVIVDTHTNGLNYVPVLRAGVSYVF